MIEDFIAALRRAGMDATGQELAEALWLAPFLTPGAEPERAQPPPPPEPPPSKTSPPEPPGTTKSSRPPEPPPKGDGEADVTTPGTGPVTKGDRVAFRSPGAPALPHALALGRALRPLRRRILSRRNLELDERATADEIARSGLWIPVMRPARSRWLEVALVVDDSRSMAIWRQTLQELRTLLRYHGAFRDVRTWMLRTGEGELRLLHGAEPVSDAAGRNPGELKDTSGRRLIIVASDCVSPAWHSGAVAAWLRAWGRSGPVVLLELLPQRVWVRTALRRFPALWLHGAEPGAPNARLTYGPSPGVVSKGRIEIPLPIITLERESLAAWAGVVAGHASAWSPGVLLRTPAQRKTAAQEAPLDARARVARFESTASPLARKLARLLAAAPLSLQVMQLVRQVLLPQAEQTHLAEVFLSGLLDEVTSEGEGRYEFVGGVRDILLESSSLPDSVEVLRRVSGYIENRLGQALDFEAMLQAPSTVQVEQLSAAQRPFARVAASVLRHLGGEYTTLAGRLVGSTRRAAPARDAQYAMAWLRLLALTTPEIFTPTYLSHRPRWLKFVEDLAREAGVPLPAQPSTFPTGVNISFHVTTIERLLHDFGRLSELEDRESHGLKLQGKLAPFLIQDAGDQALGAVGAAFGTIRNPERIEAVDRVISAVQAHLMSDEGLADWMYTYLHIFPHEYRFRRDFIRLAREMLALYERNRGKGRVFLDGELSALLASTNVATVAVEDSRDPERGRQEYTDYFLGSEVACERALVYWLMQEHGVGFDIDLISAISFEADRLGTRAETSLFAIDRLVSALVRRKGFLAKELKLDDRFALQDLRDKLELRADADAREILERLVPLLADLSAAPAEDEAPGEAPGWKWSGKWILVAGTGAREPSAELKFLCSLLGESLAEAGYGLIGAGWPGVDELVGNAYVTRLRALGGDSGRYFVQILEEGKTPRLSEGTHRTVSPDQSFLAPIQQANAVVLLGGMGGPFAAFTTAMSARKLALPLPGTGGDAQDAFRVMQEDPEYLWHVGLSRRSLERLNTPVLTPDQASHAVNELITLIARTTTPADVAAYAAAMLDLIQAIRLPARAFIHAQWSAFLVRLSQAEGKQRLERLPSDPGDPQKALSSLRSALPGNEERLMDDFERFQELEEYAHLGAPVQAALVPLLMEASGAEAFAIMSDLVHTVSKTAESTLSGMSKAYQATRNRPLTEIESAFHRTIIDTLAGFAQSMNDTSRAVGQLLQSAFPTMGEDAIHFILDHSSSGERALGYLLIQDRAMDRMIDLLAPALAFETDLLESGRAESLLPLQRLLCCIAHLRRERLLDDTWARFPPLLSKMLWHLHATQEPEQAHTLRALVKSLLAPQPAPMR